MIAYDIKWLFNLSVVKEAKRWFKDHIVPESQYKSISEAHPSQFYHPNIFIRILLFLATLVALGGITGLLGLMLIEAFEEAIEVLCILYGLGSWAFMEIVFIRNGKHYKSGVNEALLYHSIGWTIGGFAALTDFNEQVLTLTCLAVFAFSAVRYGDLISTAMAFGSFAYMIFDNFYNAGGIFTQIIPIVFIIVFTPVYFGIRWARKKPGSWIWDDCLILLEFVTLLVIYAAGNYFVVREMSEKMMNLYIEPGSDIPFAGIFYALTVIIPVMYLYFGLTRKDVILIRVSLIAIAFSVFTFKYYFSLGHPEITLTLAGAVLLATALYFFRYLKTPRYGYTRESLLKEKWADANPEAFIISQTMGGNTISGQNQADMGGGGKFGGGGSSDAF
jgi:uncharacterized membrane protein YgcG